jgi:16S rRNA (cytosine967-C5)-methyltransferase
MVRAASQPAAGSGSATPSRTVAYETVRRVSDGAYADRAFRAEAERARLAPVDRAFAQYLSFGTVQRRRTLDYVLTAVSARPIDSLDPPLLDALRLGVYQLLFMDSVPDHAAVAETVELAKSAGGGGFRFANAVLRRAARERRALLEQLTDETPADAAVLHSHPEWLARLWWDVLGPEEARALLAHDNTPPENAMRVNGLVATTTEISDVLQRRKVPTHGDDSIPEALVLEAPFDVEHSRLFESGAMTPQSRGSMRVARFLDPQPGERVLDLCAAPGTKTTHIAALMEGEGTLVAIEKDPTRAESLAANCRRMHAGFVNARCADAATLEPTESFDRVLLDAPCSNLGTLQNRPDARWRTSPEQIDELAALQERLLDSAAAQLRPGGLLVYSTCTISPRENRERVDALLAARPDLSLDDVTQTLPHRDHTDGFFMARVRRAA